MYYYKVYNVTIKVPFAIPELVGTGDDQADIIIEEDGVSNNLENISGSGDFFGGTLQYQINSNDVLLKIDKIGKYWIKDKKTIIIDRIAGVSDADIALYLLGTCFAYIIMLNGGFAIHGSAIKIGESCVIFTGDSGVGKSTTAARLIEKRYSLLADDVCVITFDTEGAIVHPAYPQLKLWDNSVEKLGYDKADLKTVSDSWQKFRLSVKDIYHTIPVKIMHVFELIPSDSEEIQCRTLQGLDKLKLLLANTYRNFFIPSLNLEKSHFQFCTQLAQQIEVKQIERPRNLFLIDELIELVESEIKMCV